MLIAIIVIVAIVVIAAVAMVCVSNGIVRADNKCDAAWQTIDAQLQRRNDLIPNLVETVKGYAAHESGTLEAVTAARTAVASAATPEAKMEASGQLTQALRGLLAVAESYPDLKANANFQQLQSDLTDTENRISYARMSYNDVVMAYNNAIQTFPGSLVAGGRTKRQGFTVSDDAVREVPEVKF
jgi:LemA protein